MRIVYMGMRVMSQKWSGHENSVYKCESNESEVEQS